MGDNLIFGSDSDFVTVNVSNSKNDFVAFEVKFPKFISVGELKQKLQITTGGNAGTMRLELYKGEKLVTKMDDDDAELRHLPIFPGSRIHVIDNFTLIADESVPKLELSDEQYASKRDTVRNYLKMNRLGKYNEEEMQQKLEKQTQKEEEVKRRAELCTIGARCQVSLPGHPTRRGTVMYNGPLDGKNGTFIGIKYDEPLGRNNGSIDGKVYFECGPNYGGFVPPMAVEVGDFPPEHDELDDDDDL